MLACCCYCSLSLNTTFVNKLCDIINNIHVRFQNLLLVPLGGFNYPNIVWCAGFMCPYANPLSSECEAFLALCTQFSLCQLVTKPARTTATTAIILDLVLASSSNFVTSISILPVLSDHSFVQFELNVAVSQSVNQRKCICNYHSADFVSINNELCAFLEQFLKRFFGALH